MATIVTTTPADYETIRQLAYKIWPVTYGPILSKEQLDFMLGAFYSIETIRKNVTESRHVFLLVKENDQDSGFVCYEHQYKNKLETRIHKIYLLPEIQGKGIGKLLLEKVAALAKEVQSKRLSLNVNRFNTALYFYTKNGFQITAEEDIEIGSGYLMEDYIMEKQL